MLHVYDEPDYAIVRDYFTANYSICQPFKSPRRHFRFHLTRRVRQLLSALRVIQRSLILRTLLKRGEEELLNGQAMHKLTPPILVTAN